MRVVSLTFDDGLIDSARLATELMPDAHLCFYLVSGWLDGSVPITEPGNVGLNHGTIEEWEELAAAGHDLGCHSHSHPMPYPPGYLADCERSRQWFAGRSPEPVHFAFPYCRVLHVPPGFRSYKAGEKTGFYNPLRPASPGPILNGVNPVWDYVSRKMRPFDAVFTILGEQPPDSWLVLTFHGIGEGWGPVTAAEFSSLGAYLRGSDHQIKTVSEMIP